MKAIDFAKILREIIKKEVRTVIREELREALKPNKQPLFKDKPLQTPFMKKVSPELSIPKTGNVGLDAILNETAMSMRNGQSAPITDSEDYPDMSSQFTADQAQGFGYMTQQYSSEDTETAYYNPADPTSQFIKDYSPTLKAAEAINSGKRG